MALNGTLRSGARCKESFWKHVVGQWASSGEPATRFCERRGLCPRSFYRWRSRLRREGDASGSAARLAARATRLLPVRVVEQRSSPQLPATGVCDSGVEVVLRGQRRLRLNTGFEESVLERAVRILEALPC